MTLVLRLSAFSLGAFLALSPARADVKQSVETILQLAAELEKGGTRLCVARMPVRDELYGLNTDAYDSPLAQPHDITVFGDSAEKQLIEGGVPVIDLYADIRRESLLADIFEGDRFHFKPEPESRIAGILNTRLQGEGIMTLPGKKQKVVFMGECFAESFAREIIKSDSQDEIKVLNKNGGGNLVHNYLFVFREEYLEDTDVVVWIFTDRHFSNSNFALLEPNPELLNDVEPRFQLARMKTTTQLELGDETNYNYPDALRASLFQVEDTGEQFIAIDQIMKDRQITRGRKVRVGANVRLKMIPWQAWIRENPAMVKLYLIDDVEDFTLPRYWVEDWLVEDE